MIIPILQGPYHKMHREGIISSWEPLGVIKGIDARRARHRRKEELKSLSGLELGQHQVLCTIMLDTLAIGGREN